MADKDVLASLSDDELLEYYELLETQLVTEEWDKLNNPVKGDVNDNYLFLYECFYGQKYQGEKLVAGKKGVVLEGSARSGKTFSALKFICKVCKDSIYPLTVNIVKETYNEFKTTIYKDFRILLDELGLDNPFNRLKEVDSFKIGKSYVNFIGADNANKIHGNTSDIIYFNEVLPIDEGVFQQSIMRCSKFWIVDYNPSVTEHWVYKKVIPRPDVGYLRSTFRGNPLIPIQQKNEIMAYEPFLPNSYEIVGEKEIYYNGKPIDEKNQPPPHPENVKNGTADLYMWRVYGLGLRGAMQGVIFTNVKYIDKSEIPVDVIGGYIYGLDFGFTTDPSVLTRVWVSGNDLYVEVLSYEPYDNPDELAQMLEMNEVEKYIPITCDSADKYSNAESAVEMVVSLQDMGYEAFKVSKTKGVIFWLNLMRSYRIHFIQNKYIDKIKVEVENYKFKEIQGIMINQAIDKFNHIWDSVRYAFMAYHNDSSVEAEWY